MGKASRVRACLAVVHDNKIVLVPHYDTVVGSVQWLIPGDRVEFGESLREAAIREFSEETGLQVRITGLLDISEVILPEKPWHSITVTFSGSITDGKLTPEANHKHGKKMPQWFSLEEIERIRYHPKKSVEKALGITSSETSNQEVPL